MEETRGIADVVEAVSYPSAALDELMASEDAAEGVTAFAAKRRPRWRNRLPSLPPAPPQAHFMIVNSSGQIAPQTVHDHGRRQPDAGCSITASGPG
jgi:hypothetical protein